MLLEPEQPSTVLEKALRQGNADNGYWRLCRALEVVGSENMGGLVWDLLQLSPILTPA